MIIKTLVNLVSATHSLISSKPKPPFPGLCVQRRSCVGADPSCTRLVVVSKDHPRSSFFKPPSLLITTHNCHPGRPVTEPKIVFNEFLDETTPVPNVIDVDNVKTVDLAGFDQEDEDFPIYDTEIVVLNTFPNHSSYITLSLRLDITLPTNLPSSPCRPPHLSRPPSSRTASSPT